MSEIKLTSFEKAELLKDTIYKLYSEEGRSFVYIGKLLGINHQTISKKVKEWEFPEPEPRHHLKPSNEKFLRENRQLIKARYDDDITTEDIAKELNVSRTFIERTIVPNDPVLLKARQDSMSRRHQKAIDRINSFEKQSYHDYDFKDLPGERWKDILGYPGYMISDHGRVKSYAEKYGKYHLITARPNKYVNNRLYVTIPKGGRGGKRINLQVSRLVAFAFCDGYSKEKNTVNHKDGNVQNDYFENLEWVSQSENNKHAYDVLGRKYSANKMEFKKIIYKDKYEFKTIAALARFLGKSKTQTCRYMKNPEKYDIKIIK